MIEESLRGIPVVLSITTSFLLRSCKALFLGKQTFLVYMVTLHLHLIVPTTRLLMEDFLRGFIHGILGPFSFEFRYELFRGGLKEDGARNMGREGCCFTKF